MRRTATSRCDAQGVAQAGISSAIEDRPRALLARGCRLPPMWAVHNVTPVPGAKTRAVRFEDVPSVLRLIRRAVEYGCRHHYTAGQREVVFQSYASTLFVDALGPFRTFAAEHQGRIVGVAQLDVADNRLRALFVDVDMQGRGIGRTLLAQVEACAGSRGPVRLHGAMSLNAVPFYRRAGFRICAGYDRLVTAPTWVPVVRMEKLVQAAA